MPCNRGFGSLILCALLVASMGQVRDDSASFINWETPQVHPIDLTGNHVLLVTNTGDDRLELFDATGAVPVSIGDIPVGINPVSVRVRTNSQAWVVNHISDSVSIVNLDTRSVIATLHTADEPTDVVFAGDPQRAFVSCSQANLVQVFDPNDFEAPPIGIPIQGEDPRAMAVSPDGAKVYVAIFESGNGTTIISGLSRAGAPNTVSNPIGPYGGVNPPPNHGELFEPPINPALPTPPPVGLIVRKNADGQWLDDNAHDWTDMISGANAGLSGRRPGWDLPDNDVAIIDTATHSVSYARRLMNLCMGIAVNPQSGQVGVIGTEALNEIRFEPNQTGRFIRVNFASFDPVAPSSAIISDLNPHLTYERETLSDAERLKAVGDPRAIVWRSDGKRGYVAGMGSNNIIAIDAAGRRVGGAQPLPVGEGPTGLALDELHDRLYVLNRFAASVSVIDTAEFSEVARIPFFDPTPAAIRTGRKHLYDTFRNSSLGHIACASCHVDGRMDRLAWDLGNPSGEMKVFDQNCQAGVTDVLGHSPCVDWHPMKGPMTTQTLQDIIGKEPLHWRGDRAGIEEFAGAFLSLQGQDRAFTAEEMAEFKAFLATIYFPPNPYRNFDNTLRTDMSFVDQYTSGRFGPAGELIPNGSAVRGLELYRHGRLDNRIDCVSCHTLPTGVGTNYQKDFRRYRPLPPGPDGGMHHAIRALDEGSFKIAQLRSVYDKVGLEGTQLVSRSGFGYFHDGSVDSLARFASLPFFDLQNDQEVADLVAFLLSFAGSDLPMGDSDTPLELPGPLGNDTHAAVGQQLTLDGNNGSDFGVLHRLEEFLAIMGSDRLALVAKGRLNESPRGFTYIGSRIFQSDRLAEQFSLKDLEGLAASGSEITFTVVPGGTQTRIGVDHDSDGFFDGDEVDLCSDPDNALSTPNTVVISGDADHNGFIDLADWVSLSTCAQEPSPKTGSSCRCTFDFDRDLAIDLKDVAGFQIRFSPQQ